jgi:hypothetical protein
MPTRRHHESDCTPALSPRIAPPTSPLGTAKPSPLSPMPAASGRLREPRRAPSSQGRATSGKCGCLAERAAEPWFQERLQGQQR